MTIIGETNGTKFFISCRVENQFNLIGTWCHGANSPTFGYIGQLWKYIQINKQQFGQSIIAGDFNSNKIWDRWDRWWNHSDVVRELEEIGILSIYHKHFIENQGEETSPTFYLYRKNDKPYHIDYIFASDNLIDKILDFKIGCLDNFLEFSDHAPIYARLKING